MFRLEKLDNKFRIVFQTFFLAFPPPPPSFFFAPAFESFFPLSGFGGYSRVGNKKSQKFSKKK